MGLKRGDSVLDLSAEKVDLWYLDNTSRQVLDAELSQAYIAVLNEQESRRYKRLQINAKREQFLLGKFFLRQVLSRYLPVAPLAWSFSENEHGKPELTGEGGNTGAAGAIAFNLSHSQNLFVVAVSAADAVGVDIEYAARSRRIMELARRHFSSDENQALQALTGDQQLARFYHIWTLKEAYVKARGLGLTMPLQDFSLHFATDYALEFSQHQSAEIPAKNWQFWSLALQSKDAVEPYTVSVAVGNAARNSELRLFEFVGVESERQVQPDLIARTI